MLEVVNSRNGLTAFGAAAFLAGAVLSWVLPGPDWMTWPGLAFALLGSGLAYRLLVPIDATFVVDARGIRWSIGERRSQDVAWDRLKTVCEQGDDDIICLEVSGGPTVRVPGVFLRDAELRNRFYSLVQGAKPGISLPDAHQCRRQSIGGHRASV